MIERKDVVAVGDIHGRFDLLLQVVQFVKGSGCSLIFLGDLIDRGSSSLACVALVRQICENPASIGILTAQCLQGNHEDALVAYQSEDPFLRSIWPSLEGDTILASALERHISWIDSLPLWVTSGSDIFVHAGLVPGEDPSVSLRKGRKESLKWIREPFLTQGPLLGAWTSEYKRVIHGHSPVFDDSEVGVQTDPDIAIKGDRIGIDTGAVWSGVLTAFNATKDEFYQFTNDQVQATPSY